MLRSDIGGDVRDLIREICRSEDIEILQGHVRTDHGHLLLSVPPHTPPSRVMQAIRKKASRHLLRDRRKLRVEFSMRHLWARGYFVCTSGNVTDEVIAQYIQLQVPSPRTRTAFASARTKLVSGDGESLNDFSRPQNPSPSGEGPLKHRRLRRNDLSEVGRRSHEPHP